MDELIVEHTFGPGPLGIGFTKAADGMPVRIEKLVPGSQAESMKGLEVGAPLFAVNGEAVGERSHAEAISMIKAAASGAETAKPAGSAPARLSFVEQEDDTDDDDNSGMMPAAAEAPSPAPQAQPLDSGKPPSAWVTGLAGTWEATGQLSGSTERETELLLLRVSASGELSGYVDDGDGDFDADDCKIGNGQCVENSEYGTCHVGFDQVFSDGAVTRWECTYSSTRDMLVAGTWTGDVSGIFEASRRQEDAPEPTTEEGGGVNLSARFDGEDQGTDDTAEAAAEAASAGAERVAKLEEQSPAKPVLTPARRISVGSGNGSEAASPFAAARDELETLTRGAATLFSEAERDLEESAARTAELELMVEARDAEVRRLAHLLVERDATIREKNEQLVHKDERLAKLSTALRALTHEVGSPVHHSNANGASSPSS